MQPIKVQENVYWVGAIDWQLRNFHGYLTQRGTTFNSYLILDDKIVLIDTVKHNGIDQMLERISKVIDPGKIDYVVSNHVEMDHSGGIEELTKVAKNLTVITSPGGEKGLKAHYNQNWNFKIIKSGEIIPIGNRNLQFFPTPMVHWPDNMVTYLVEDKILFSNDAFGQHLASSERFDDDYPFHIIMEEAKKYYANIVLPYAAQVNKALEVTSGLNIETIAPAHGICWRSHIDDIVKAYKKWAANQTDKKALIIYDTMWGSTEKIAQAVANAFENKGINISMLNLRHNHISDIMTEVLTAQYICVGSPTLNNNMLPTVASFLTYLKGLSPKNRSGLAFGSYGWNGQSVSQVEEILTDCGFVLVDSVKVQYVPDEERLVNITAKLEQTIENL